MTTQINIELDRKRIETQSIEEKVDLLVDLGFANRASVEIVQRDINSVKTLLYGNGKVGLCETIRMHTKQFTWQWIIISALGGAMLTFAGIFITILK